MKMRLGFVSNSSSSSFVCNVCGEEVSGWDYCLSNAEMYQCEDGHTFCMSHTEINVKVLVVSALQKHIDVYPDESEAEKKKLAEYLKDEDNKLNYDEIFEEMENEGFEIIENLPSEFCPICSFKVIQESDLVDYLIKQTKISKSEVFMSIKLFNKKRKVLYNHEYIDYVINKKMYADKKTIEAEITSKFKNYEEFYQFLNQ